MLSNQSESHARTEIDLDDYEADEDSLGLYAGDDELPVASYEDDGDGPESSLDELLARRAANAALEGEEEARLADLGSLLDDGRAESRAQAAPPKRPEFVCARCRLVKPRVQLSDAARPLCRDCA